MTSDGDKGNQDVSQAHYRDGGKVCMYCEHYDESSQICKIGVNGGQVEPEGGCDLFEQMADEGQQNQGGQPADANNGAKIPIGQQPVGMPQK